MSNRDLLASVNLFEWTARELPIRFLGDQVLSIPCKPVKEQEFGTSLVNSIAEELINTLTKYRKHTGMGRGLAANQIGHSKRIVVVWLDDKPKVLCNPEVMSSEGLGSYWESCISSGTLLVGEVHRPWSAIFKYLDTDGNQQELKADEKLTRVLLHEIDHLDGITCNEKYQPKTEKIVSGGKEEILSYSFKRLK